MSSKFKKLLLSIIVLVIGILISGTAQAGSITDGGDIIKDDITDKGYISNHHFTPTAEEGGMLFCIDKGVAFKASMTREEYTKDYTAWTTKKCEKDGPVLAKPSTGTFLRYSMKNEEINEELGYIFATAAERGIDIEGNMFMADTVWASSIGNRQDSPTWLNTEAKAYMEWRKEWNKWFEKYKNGEKNLEIAEPDNKIKVAVDQKARNPYTVGKFQATFPTASGNPGTRITYTENENKKISTAIKKLVKVYDIAKKITTEDVNQNGAWSHFITVRSNAKDLLDTTVDGIKIADLVEEEYGYIEVSDELYNRIKTTCNNLIKRQGELTNKHTGKKINKGGNIELIKTEHTTTDSEGNGKITYTWEDIELVKPIGDTETTNLKDEEQDDYVFSYISEVTINGYDDVKGGNKIQTLTNNVNNSEDSPFEIIGANGETFNTIVMKDGHSTIVHNLPQPNIPFYVRFNPEDGVKSIEVCVTVRYINGCEAKIRIYSGTMHEWVWQKHDEYHCSECTTTTVGHVHGDGSCSITKYYSHWYTKSDGTVTSEIQKIVWIEKKPGSREAYGIKNWDNLLLSLKDGNTRIDITMELGGHAFIDEDQGKVNTGDNLFKNKETEALANVEVWLYECDINGEHEKFTGKIMTTMGEDENGSYVFTQLDAMKKYRVKFVYNGLLYANVDNKLLDAEYNSEEWKQTSKVDENGDVNRNKFNERFKEIGSYPQNYEIVNKGIFPELGKYNIAYPQEEIVTYFQEISANMAANGGDLKKACETVKDNYIRKGVNEEEAKRKTQFAADCRIEAWTNKDKVAIKDPYGGTNSTYIYPVYDEFTTTTENATERIAGKDIKPIYEGQRFINCGIKNRSKIDLELYKDVFKAEITINGKQEIYEYDARRKGKNNARFEIGRYDSSKEQTVGSATFLKGIEEDDYNQQMGNAYKQKGGQNFTNTLKTRDIDNDSYTLNMREEEANNGEQRGEQYGENGNYAGHNDYSLVDPQDRLKVFITYKIALRNNGSEPGIITEIADYYDNNYAFARAYIADEDGNNPVELPRDNTNRGVGYSENSKYGTATQYKSNKNAYKTMYIRVGDLELTSKDKEQYLYVVLQLFKSNEEDAGQILMNSDFVNGSGLTVINLAEINGYKNVNGLLDKDSNPGNLNISNIDALAQANIVNYPGIRDMYEDDTDRAPAFIFTKYAARTVEGQVFEDATGKEGEKIHTGSIREGDGCLKDGDTGIEGVEVQLLEISKNQDGTETTTTRAKTYTNESGWYGFVGFLPGNYKIRYIYGHNNETAMIENVSVIEGGKNAKSYNGQDFKSTKYDDKADKYWYKVEVDNGISKSDAKDYAQRRTEILEYSTKEYERDIVNHKAEVFNSYLGDQPKHIYDKKYTPNNKDTINSLANELKEQTYCDAYTPTLEVEVEYATQTKSGNENKDAYTHKITGVDFGVVERPRSELVIDQDVAHIKVTAADGVTVLFDTNTGTNNLQWVNHNSENKPTTPTTNYYKGTKISAYDKNELLNVIMDEELIDGATIEITYDITVTNNGEKDTYIDNDEVKEVTTRAKNIINYVSNNLTFDVEDNKGTDGKPLWEVVKLSDIQNDKNSTGIHQKFSIRTDYGNEEFLDLTNQQVILKATTDNPLTTIALEPGKSTKAQLKLKKKMSTEGANDNLVYTNMTEIVEIENSVGRYDHGATPGNQDINYNPQEHDTSGASYYDRQEDYPDTGKNRNTTPQDGKIIVTPPTGSTHIYYIIGIVGTVLLAVGIYLIKKFVLDNRK